MSNDNIYSDDDKAKIKSIIDKLKTEHAKGLHRALTSSIEQLIDCIEDKNWILYIHNNVCSELAAGFIIVDNNSAKEKEWLRVATEILKLLVKIKHINTNCQYKGKYIDIFKESFLRFIAKVIDSDDEWAESQRSHKRLLDYPPDETKNKIKTMLRYLFDTSYQEYEDQLTRTAKIMFDNFKKNHDAGNGDIYNDTTKKTICSLRKQIIENTHPNIKESEYYNFLREYSTIEYKFKGSKSSNAGRAFIRDTDKPYMKEVGNQNVKREISIDYVTLNHNYSDEQLLKITEKMCRTTMKEKTKSRAYC